MVILFMVQGYKISVRFKIYSFGLRFIIEGLGFRAWVERFRV
jgi:hypothetical protein